MRVVVTGCACGLAEPLLPLLAADGRFTQIIGVDPRETGFRHERFAQVLLDLRSPQLARVLAGADAVVHYGSLAAGTNDNPADRERRRDLNLNGGQNVFRHAAQQGVGCAVHVSSAAVYALPARRHPIEEDHPRAALAGFPLAEDQVALEGWLDAYEQEHASVRLVRLRPHLVVGRGAPAWLPRLLRLPFSARHAGRPPRLQCVHARDLAQAVLLALTRQAAGAFNLACADAATLREMQRIAGGGLIPLPLPLFHQLLRLTRRPHAAFGPAWTEALRHEIVLDTRRARRHLGWKPQYDSVQRSLETLD